ncbi:MAG: flagellar biosynthetic protein FliR, partial [Enterobacterales bacterium]|nr:flagellar biosynthetic protein FliR [Enterobacterales bacterium]
MDTVISYEFQQIEALMRSFLWPFIRISSMFMSMVVLGSSIVSAQKRVVTAFLICLVVVPVLPPMPQIALFSYSGFMVTLQQIFIGVTVGFVSRLIFETFIIGGQIVAMSSGLGFAQINDPSSGVVVPAVGQFFLMMTTLIFLAVDGHLLMIDTIVQSFYSMPIGVEGISMSALWGMFDMAGGMFAVGLKMALAAVISILMVNLSFGILTKVAPTLNIFVIGFPIILTFGLLILWFTLNGFNEYFDLRMLQG